MVKINLNIEKKHLLVLLIFLSLFTIALVIAVNPSTKPNPGHASNEVMVNIAGTDKTLQAAIDDGSFGGGGLSTCTYLGVNAGIWGTGVVIDVPAKCKFPSTCRIVIMHTYQSTNEIQGVGIHDYTQFPDGSWASSYINGADVNNGDSTAHWIAYAAGYSGVADDYSWATAETNSNQWTLTNSGVGYNTTAYLC